MQKRKIDDYLGRFLEDVQHRRSEKIESDRALVCHRFRVRKDLSRIKNRVKSLLFQIGISIPEYINDNQSRHWTKCYVTNYELLLSIPGIGMTAATLILTQIDNIKRFGSLDELCNYLGLVPSMHGSGDNMKMGKLINRGRKELKITLIEASWKAIRKDPALMAKFNELIKKMHKNKAIIRIARKMVGRIRHVLIQQEKYEIGVLK